MLNLARIRTWLWDDRPKTPTLAMYSFALLQTSKMADKDKKKKDDKKEEKKDKKEEKKETKKDDKKDKKDDKKKDDKKKDDKKDKKDKGSSSAKKPDASKASKQLKKEYDTWVDGDDETAQIGTLVKNVVLGNQNLTLLWSSHPLPEWKKIDGENSQITFRFGDAERFSVTFPEDYPNTDERFVRSHTPPSLF